MSYSTTLPKAFVKRRLHSLTGLWLVLFLIIHLFENSQAALFFGDSGSGFIRAVNGIHDLPFLPIIELALIALPIIIHAVWGIQYIRSAKYNSFPSDGSTPSLPKYPRNHAYTWQRLTSWFLLVAIIAHVVHMRVWQYPVVVTTDQQQVYLVHITDDPGLVSVAKRLGVDIYSEAQIEKDPQPNNQLLSALQKMNSKDNSHLIAASKNFGTAELLIVRDVFKKPLMIGLYTIFVLAACFHAFNGLWTFMISWGVTLSEKAQAHMRRIATTLMVLIAFLGLASIWGTYWINLYQ